MPAMDPSDAARTLIFVRHGATALNLTALRCGGDLDVPLVEVGRRQAFEAGQRLRALQPAVGVIVASHLMRTRETAAIIGRFLPGVEIVIDPAFAERRLGAWNGRPLADTQSELEAGAVPPGGESNADFVERIAAAVDDLLPRLECRPLLVGSKGVARVLGELLGRQRRHHLDNGEIVRFDLSRLVNRSAEVCQS